MTGSIDSHVHFFPKELRNCPITWAKNHSEPLWQQCVAPTDRQSIQGWASDKEMLKAMDEAAIERVILLGWYWENQTTASSQNRIYKELMLKYPDRISAFAALQPSQTKDALEELAWIKDNGFLGVGELHAQAQGYSLKSDCFRQILEAMDGSGLILNFHVTDPNSKDHPGKVETPLADFLWLAEEYPNQITVLSHLGGLLPVFAKQNGLKLPKNNIYYDTAAVPLLYQSEIINTIRGFVGSENILFGTDFPLRVFPKTQKQPDFHQSVEFVKQLNLPAPDQNKIFRENSKRLFQL